jgi:hypothetical protein
MAEFSQLKVSQIKDAVLKADPTFDYSLTTGKSAWVDLAESMGLTADMIASIETAAEEFKDILTTDESFAEMLENAEIETGVPETTGLLTIAKTTADTGSTPKYTEVGWHDYVMSKFDPTELDRGYPKVEGMRRLAEELLGEIIFSGAVEFNSSMPEDDYRSGRSIVNYELQIAWKNGVEVYVHMPSFQYPTRVFRGLASCFPGNVKGDVFAVFPESIAETRAEARALRKALGLKVIAAEELGGGDVKESSQVVSSEKIQDQQKFWITKNVTENDLKLDEILMTFGLKTLEESTRQTGAEMIKHITGLMKEQN